MPELTLWEALCECAPKVGDPAVDEPRKKAMVMVYRALHDIARHRNCDEDLASKVFERLVASGPNRRRAASDDEARRYLGRAVTNGQKDQWRAGHGVAPLPDDIPTHDTPHHQLHIHEEEVARKALADETWRDFKKVAGEAAERLRSDAQAGFADEIEVRRRIALGETTCAEEVQRRDGRLDSRSRNRFDQAQSRAMKRMAEAVERSGLPEPRRARLSRLVDALKRHESSWAKTPATDEGR